MTWHSTRRIFQNKKRHTHPSVPFLLRNSFSLPMIFDQEMVGNDYLIPWYLPEMFRVPPIKLPLKVILPLET